MEMHKRKELHNECRISNLLQPVEHLGVFSKISLVIPLSNHLSIDLEQIDIRLPIEPTKLQSSNKLSINLTDHFQCTTYCSTYDLIVT